MPPLTADQQRWHLWFMHAVLSVRGLTCYTGPLVFFDETIVSGLCYAPPPRPANA